MVTTDRTPTSPATTSGSTPAHGTGSGSGTGTTIVPVDVIDDLMNLLGGQADHLEKNVVATFKQGPHPARFGNAPLARQLSGRVDSVYADLHYALTQTVTGLRSYRDGFKAYRDGMTEHDADVADQARRKQAGLPAQPPPDLSAGDRCFDGSRSTARATSPLGSDD